MPDSLPDNDDVRINAEDVGKPSDAELQRIRDLADVDIDTSDVPDVVASAEAAGGRVILLQLDADTLDRLRARGDVASQLREAVRRYIDECSEDAA